MSQYDNTFTGVYGTLTVFIHRAKDLINVRKLDKQSPFIILRIQHMTARSKVSFRGGQTPNWSFLAKFEITPEIKPLMALEIFHETDDAPKFVGKANVDITTAIFSDENDGDDRWIDLKNGVEDAGKVYVELSFKIKSASEINTGGHTVLDDIDQFDQSVASRQLPPLPHESLQWTDDEENETETNMNSGNGFGYTHGVPGGPIPRTNKTGAGMSSGRANFEKKKVVDENTYSRRSNVYSNDMEAPRFANSSDSKQSKVADSEPLFAKLKELKGKMFNFKNQPLGDNESAMSKSNDSNINRNNQKVDFQELEKAVGVTSSDETYIEEDSVNGDENYDDVDEELEPRFKLFNMANSRRVTSRVTERGASIHQERQQSQVHDGDYGKPYDPNGSRRSSHYASPTRNFTVFSNDNSPRRNANNNHNSPTRRPPPPPLPK